MTSLHNFTKNRLREKKTASFENKMDACVQAEAVTSTTFNYTCKQYILMWFYPFLLIRCCMVYTRKAYVMWSIVSTKTKRYRTLKSSTQLLDSPSEQHLQKHQK